MVDEQAFIQAIIEAPDDDGLRLIYADWLEEQGRGDRAEFIRIQIELWKRYSSDARFVDAEGKRLVDRGLKLLEVAAVKDWAHFPGYVCFWQWKRGFVECVTCEGSDWPKCAGLLLSQHPIQEVTLTTAPRLEDGKFASLDDYEALWPQVKKWNLPQEPVTARMFRDSIPIVRDPRRFIGGPILG